MAPRNRPPPVDVMSKHRMLTRSKAARKRKPPRTTRVHGFRFIPFVINPPRIIMISHPNFSWQTYRNTGRQRSLSPSADVSLMSAHSDIIDKVEKMTDEQLYQELLRRKQTVGPVVDSTRNMYKKKLKRILVKEFKKNRGDSSSSAESEQESEKVSSSKRGYLNGSSTSASSSSHRTQSSSSSTKESFDTSAQSFRNGFSSGESDIDNVQTLEDYGREGTPKTSRIGLKTFVSPRKVASPRKQVEKSPTESFRALGVGPSRRVTTGNISSGFESFATTTTEQRSHRLSTGVSVGQREWSSPTYEVSGGRGFVTGKPRPENTVFEREQRGTISAWMRLLFCGILGIVLAILIFKIFFTAERELTEDEAIDKQIEETLKLLADNPEIN